VTKIVRDWRREVAADRDHWSEPWPTLSLLLATGAVVLWWVASVLAGSIWLALWGQGIDKDDHVGDLGDER